MEPVLEQLKPEEEERDGIEVAWGESNRLPSCFTRAIRLSAPTGLVALFRHVMVERRHPQLVANSFARSY